MQLRSVLAVFLGGALGTATRALLQEALPEWWLLFAVNALGSALLGLSVAALSTAPAWLRHGVGAGVLGGFTSYSAVAVASASATATTGGWGMAAPALPGIAIALGMLAVSLLGAWLGLVLGRRLAARAPAGRRPDDSGAA
ncbi:CrcB family protein [Agrococcus sp. 1P02AA]|uniref:fluoride efflux transporter FluC n=1 Tax=Agrococcus sp. 1P02AA TaxID=3132259 RepID=UPI0039A4D51D